ncbi:hypothetical protein H8S50_19145, partial [Xanthomonas translucens pv. undulosa]|nr:hypothetical protein [Xanthomonas translucens pv. undulosa]
SWFTGAGKLMGVAGGVIGGVLAIKDGVEIKGKHPLIGYPLIVLGTASVIAAILLIFVGMAGVGLIIGIIIAIIMTVIYWIKPNSLQDWLIDTQFGRVGESTSRESAFKGLIQQQVALENIAR